MAPYSVREALAAFRRTPLLGLLSVLAIGLSLFVVGLFGLTAFNVQRAITGIEERVEVVAYLRDGTQEEQIRIAEQELQAFPEVLSLRFVSKTEALAIAMQEMEEFRNVYSDLDVNPLPASLEIRLREGHRNPESAERVAQRLLAYPFVEDVSFGRDWLGKIVSLRRIAGGATTILGGAFAAVAGIIIAAAIRIAVFARREEIAIMRMVGATHGFIQRPFLLEGLLSGLLGGIIAVGLTYATYQLINVTLIQVAWLPSAWPAIGVAMGAAFGLLSSAVAVRRHLRAL
jgi:cell division transport system permease protein